MVEKIKKLRVEIDGLAQLTKELRPIEYVYSKKELELYNQLYSETENGILGVSQKYNSKEIEKATDSLYLAKAWLGKVLGELGTQNPYGSGYKTKEDIVSTQDVSGPVLVFEDFNHIEKVDWLRQEIEKVIKQVVNLDLKGTRELAIARTNAYTHLCESKMQLGFKLERIKNS